MKQALKVVNWIFLGLITLGSVVSAVDLGIGRMLPFLLWMILPYLTIRAADSPRGAIYKWAFGLNVFILVALAGSLLAILSAEEEVGSDIVFGFGLVLIIALIPAWNLYGLRKVKTGAAVEIELIPDDVPSAVSNAWQPSAPMDATSPEPRHNYIVRHWRGELSLPISYWVNGSLVGVLMTVIAFLLGDLSKQWPIRPTAFVMMSVLALIVVVTIWSLVGIFRSAAQHPKRGGSQGWAAAANVMGILGALSFAGQLATRIGPQMSEFASIAFNVDSIKRVNAMVTADGKSLMLTGQLGTGSYEYVTQILGATPGVRTLVLKSEGGRIREAELLAKLVRDRGLDTYVEEYCLSACTYLFLAGDDRAATPNAKLGFHRASFAGIEEEEILDVMLDYYREEGISEPFLARIRNTASKDMWYPTRAELIDDGVLTRVSLGGETATLATHQASRSEYELQFRSVPMMQAIEKRFPGTIEKAVNASWAQYESGAKDADVTAAARVVLSSVYPQLLKTADDAGLEEFLDLSIAQLTAARAVGPTACGLLLDSKLDVTKVLAPEVVQRETTWSMAQLSAEPRAPKPVPQKLLDEAFVTVVELLDESFLPVVLAPQNYADEPELRCNATLAFYQIVAAQPDRTRAILLRGMFQAE